MDEEIKTMLGEEIKKGIKDLSSLAPGSKEKSAAIEDLTKLYKLKIEEGKNELSYMEKYDQGIISDRDYEDKKAQLVEETKERYFRLGIAAAEIVLPLIFYAAWMKSGLKFEETGTYTSTTFRGLFNRFKPTKK